MHWDNGILWLRLAVIQFMILTYQISHFANHWRMRELRQSLSPTEDDIIKTLQFVDMSYKSPAPPLTWPRLDAMLRGRSRH